MEKQIKVTIVDDTGTVLDTYTVDLVAVERSNKSEEKIQDHLAEVRGKVSHEIRAALIRRAKPGQPPTPREKLRNFMSRGK